MTVVELRLSSSHPISCVLNGFCGLETLAAATPVHATQFRPHYGLEIAQMIIKAVQFLSSLPD